MRGACEWMAATLCVVASACSFGGTSGGSPGAPDAAVAVDSATIGTDAIGGGGPLQSLDDAHGATAGSHDFLIGGEAFNAHVEADGWVLVASGSSATDEAPTGYPSGAAVGIDCDCTFTPAVLAVLTEAVELRFVAVDDAALAREVTTADTRLLDRLRGDTSLVVRPDTNDVVWLGDALLEDRLTSVTCDPSSGDMRIAEKLLHACGDSNGVHWMPFFGDERIGEPGNHSLRLFVRSIP